MENSRLSTPSAGLKYITTDMYLYTIGKPGFNISIARSANYARNTTVLGWRWCRFASPFALSFPAPDTPCKTLPGASFSGPAFQAESRGNSFRHHSPSKVPTWASVVSDEMHVTIISHRRRMATETEHFKAEQRMQSYSADQGEQQQPISSQSRACGASKAGRGSPSSWLVLQ